MLSRDEAHRLTEKILSYSKFPECEVELVETDEAYVRFANNGVTNSASALKRSIRIRSTRDRKTGAVDGSDTGDAALKAAVARSEELSAISPVDPEHVDPLSPPAYPDVPGFDEATARARPGEMAPRIRTIIERARADKLQASGIFLRAASSTAVANKRGLFGFDRATDVRLVSTMRKPDGSSSGWGGQPAARIADIDAAAIANRAAGKCLAWKNPKRIDPGKYTVILEPTAAGDLVSAFRFSLDARGADEGRTFLSRKGGGDLAGEKLFPDIITLRSDPFDARLPSSPWSASLLPNRKVAWIEQGVVRNLAYDRYWAAQMKKEPVPFPGSLILDGGAASVDDLIKATNRGLLVTHFWYIRPVNPQTLQLTGLTRDGLFLIENGKVTDAVINLRFNESPVRLLQNARQLGRPERVRGFEGAAMIAPPILADNFTFSSVSDAV